MKKKELAENKLVVTKMSFPLQILRGILIFFTNFKALFDGKEEVFLKRLEEHSQKSLFF